jgi:hypothetical protein
MEIFNMSEALVSYEHNPQYFQRLSSYRGLPPLCRLFFRELLDLVWCSESHFKREYDLASIASEMGFEKSEVEDYVGRLASEECELVSFFYDLDSSKLIISVPYLERIHKSAIENLNRSRRDDIANDVRVSSTVTTLQRVCGHRDSIDPIVGYLTSSEIRRGSSGYSGWLPTARFLDTGEVFYIRNVLLSTVAKRFPDEDLNRSFTEMFDYLIRTPDRRPFLPTMNRFISGWLVRPRGTTKRFANVSEKSFSKEEDAFAALLESQLSEDN